MAYELPKCLVCNDLWFARIHDSKKAGFYSNDIDIWINYLDPKSPNYNIDPNQVAIDAICILENDLISAEFRNGETEYLPLDVTKIIINKGHNGDFKILSEAILNIANIVKADVNYTPELISELKYESLNQYRDYISLVHMAEVLNS